MRISLIDVDGHNFPNLPLMKLSAWHKQNGDQVEWYDPLTAWLNPPDMVYMSKVFTFTPDYPHPVCAGEIIKGGTGYEYPSGGKPLPEEIEHIYPDYSLYPELCNNTAYGFLTRGCPRGCDFCIVKEKEGQKSHKVSDLSEFWNGQKNIVLLDPNMFACREWKNLSQQLIDSKAWVDFSQGCDIRILVKPDIKMDFREMPFPDNTFKIVVFDPPHLKQAGSESWLAKKYGVLPKDWKPYLKAGFDECMRVLEPDGILVFKWNEEQIKLNDVLKEFGKEPLLGDQRGKTRWILFMK